MIRIRAFIKGSGSYSGYVKDKIIKMEHLNIFTRIFPIFLVKKSTYMKISKEI